MRARGDTKTRKSWRTLGLPQLAVTAVLSLHEESKPQPEDLVFCTVTGEAAGRGERAPVVPRGLPGLGGLGRTGRRGSYGTPSSA